jgi:hypothetical protein
MTEIGKFLKNIFSLTPEYPDNLEPGEKRVVYDDSHIQLKLLTAKYQCMDMAEMLRKDIKAGKSVDQGLVKEFYRNCTLINTECNKLNIKEPALIEICKIINENYKLSHKLYEILKKDPNFKFTSNPEIKYDNWMVQKLQQQTTADVDFMQDRQYRIQRQLYNKGIHLTDDELDYDYVSDYMKYIPKQEKEIYLNKLKNYANEKKLMRLKEIEKNKIKIKKDL